MRAMALAEKTVRYLVTGVVLASSIGCDQATKAIARDQLGDGASHVFLSGAIRFVHAENPGAFLGLGKNLPESWRLMMLLGGVGLVLLVVGGLLFNRLRQEDGRMPSLISLGMGFLLAGGVGNLIDRSVGASTVTDFVQLKIGPVSSGVFNVADIFIIIGAIAVAIAAFRPEAEMVAASVASGTPTTADDGPPASGPPASGPPASGPSS